jgi:hypothetical protein
MACQETENLILLIIYIIKLASGGQPKVLGSPAWGTRAPTPDACLIPCTESKQEIPENPNPLQ